MSSVNLDRHSKLLVNRYGNRRICNWIVVTIFWIIGTFLVFKIVLSYLLILLSIIKNLEKLYSSHQSPTITPPQQRHHWIRRLSLVLHPLTAYSLSHPIQEPRLYPRILPSTSSGRAREWVGPPGDEAVQDGFGQGFEQLQSPANLQDRHQAPVIPQRPRQEPLRRSEVIRWFGSSCMCL